VLSPFPCRSARVFPPPKNTPSLFFIWLLSRIMRRNDKEFWQKVMMYIY
jgi:hypothetical protein